MKRLDKEYAWALANLRSTAMRRDQAGAFDRELWQQLCATGLFDALANPGTTQTKGLKNLAHTLFSLGAGSLDVPFVFTAVAHALGISLLVEYGSESQKQSHLPGLLSGETIAAICNAEKGCGTDIRQLAASCHVTGATGTLHAKKGPATNVPHADLLLISAAAYGEGKEPALEVFLIDDRARAYQSPGDGLAGMATGANGWVDIESLPIDYQGCRLGKEGNGLKLFRHCFNLERLLVPAVIAGVMDGMLETAFALLPNRKSQGQALKNHQYVQEKLVSIYAARERLVALLARAMESMTDPGQSVLSLDNSLLALLKMSAAEEGNAAAMAFFELSGAHGYTTDNIAQKLVRDLMSLKSLGGTKELQKIVIFADLERHFLGDTSKAAVKTGEQATVRRVG